MEYADRMRIYWQISAKGLIADLIEQVRLDRPSASRNTIRLAFVAGGTTPTREMIIETGKRILDEIEAEPVEALAAT